MRAIEYDDLELMLQWRNDENIRKYFREYREFALSQKREWYESMIKSSSFEMFLIIDLKENEPIGVAGITYIDWVNRHGDVHFYIGKNGEWIDDVYAPVAIKMILNYGFNVLNLNKLWTEIYEIDTKKNQFFMSLGFSIDANLREHYYWEGKYYSSHLLSLLRKEFTIE
ncbi:MAG: GNAT family N-acetyltransferase [Bacteroidetes bacterium]|nr:GNAT family N-acetyltransferase [Bacteroidota bacterium]